MPFGGGTSVVGRRGAAARRPRCRDLLDLGRIAHVRAVDKRSLTAVLGAGLRGPAVETGLAAHGLTLGHYPQSWEYATVGGWVATRSAGQASTGYGAIDKLVSGLRCVAPGGRHRAAGRSRRPRPGPGCASSWSARRELLGVITEATLKVRPQPEAQRYEGWMFHDFEEGAEAFRALEQRHVIPDVARLSDPHETRLSMTLSDDGSLQRRLGQRYIGARGYEGGCIAILGLEGERRDVDVRARARAADAAPRRRPVARHRPRHGVEARPLRGPVPARRAARPRRDGGDARDGRAVVGPDAPLRGGRRTRSARRSQARGTPGLVMCHISHLYPDGASLYYTFIAPAAGGQRDGAVAGREVRGLRRDRRRTAARSRTTTRSAATTRPWMPREIGETGIDALRGVKQRLDPAGILNPGKVLP